MALLELQGVVAGYAGRPVLAGLSLSVEAGALTVLLGRNGAGKTTLLRVASGAIRPTAGTVHVAGADLAARSSVERARLVSGVPQEDVADFAFTLREVVALGRASRRSALAREDAADFAAIDAALAAVGLSADADRAVTEVSGGERRRASIARCLAQDARLLLLDEPAAHLDLGHALRLLASLAALARADSRAVLASMHDVNLAALVADRVVLLDAGRILADGRPADVLTPARLEEAFRSPVRVLRHPDGGGPVVVPARPPS